MTLSNNQKVTVQNRGMSNAAVLIIGVVVGLLGAGAFIFMANKSNDQAVAQPAAVSTETPQTQTAAQPVAQPATPAVVNASAQAADAAEPTQKTPAKALTPEQVKQVLAIKQALDKALTQQAQQVNEAIKAANAISDGKPVMSLDQTKLQELSSKVKLIIDAESNFATALSNVEKALVDLINQTQLDGDNKLRVAKGYLFGLSPQTAMNIRKANLARWGAFLKFVDFLSNNFGKWEFDAEKKNTKLLDESLGEELKTIVTNVNTTTAAVNEAQAQHMQVIKQRMAQIQQAQQQAKAAQAPADAAMTTASPTTDVMTTAPVEKPAP
jgi:hypothetical protein